MTLHGIYFLRDSPCDGFCLFRFLAPEALASGFSSSAMPTTHAIVAENEYRTDLCGQDHEATGSKMAETYISAGA